MDIKLELFYERFGKYLDWSSHPAWGDNVQVYWHLPGKTPDEYDEYQMAEMFKQGDDNFVIVHETAWGYIHGYDHQLVNLVKRDILEAIKEYDTSKAVQHPYSFVKDVIEGLIYRVNEDYCHDKEQLVRERATVVDCPCAYGDAFAP